MTTITLILSLWCGFGGFMLILHILCMIIDAYLNLCGIDSDNYKVLRWLYEPSKTITILYIIGNIGVILWVVFCILKSTFGF